MRADRIKVAGTDCVGYAKDVIRKIREYGTQILSDDDRDKIVELLSNANIIDEKKRKQHVLQTKEIRK